MTPAKSEKKRREVFVVLPTYSEATPVGGLLHGIDEALCKAGIPYEAIVVDDGSTDNTSAIVIQRANRLPVTPESHVRNLALGATIRDELYEAAPRAEHRDIILAMNADETHTPGLILRR